MAQNQREDRYGLQPIAEATRTIVQAGGESWAESIHTQLQGGHMSPDKGNRELKLRAMFRAIRMLDQGDDKQKRKGRELSRFLELTWGLQKAWVAAAEGDIDLGRELREHWGDAQLPPAYGATVARTGPMPGEFVHGIAADEAIIDALVRRLK
jgi:hypothetical protein